MNSKYPLLFLLCLNAVISTAAMNAATNDSIVFDKLMHPFSSFPEDGDPQTCQFRFTNHGKKLVAVAKVQTTCGCAVASYTSKPVRPGETGTIRITYHPQGRPGRFNRSALVQFSGSPQVVKLIITGNVIPGVPRKHKMYPYVIGDLQLKTETIRFGAMRGEEQEQSIVVINSGKTALGIEFQIAAPDVSASLNVPTLKPDETGEIRIIRKADKNKSKPKCIRIKKSDETQQEGGKLVLEVIGEDCN